MYKAGRFWDDRGMQTSKPIEKMRRDELIGLINELLTKLDPIQETDTLLGDMRGKQEEAAKLLESAKTVSSGIDSKKVEFDTKGSDWAELGAEIESAHDKAESYDAKIEKQQADIAHLEDKLKTSIDQANTLRDDSLRQLGAINAGVLSDAFSKAAANVGKARDEWFSLLKRWVLGLFAVTAIVVAWEQYGVRAGPNFLSAAFFLKLSITTPLLGIVFFIAGQYSKERRLHDEYSFKAAVALSFEAFRRLVTESVTDENGGSIDQEAVLNFMIETARDLYTSPTQKDKSSAVMLKEAGVNSASLQKSVDIFDQFASILRKFMKP